MVLLFMCGKANYIWEGPALITAEGKKEYHIHGIKYTLDGWKEARRNREGLPFYKQSGMNVRN